MNDINDTASKPMFCNSNLLDVKMLIEQVELLEEEIRSMSRNKFWYHYGKKIPLQDGSLNCILFALESEILDRKIQIQKLNKDVI